VVFPETVGLKLILAQKAIKEIECRVTCYVIVAQREKKSTVEHIRSIHVMDEYVDVGMWILLLISSLELAWSQWHHTGCRR